MKKLLVIGDSKLMCQKIARAVESIGFNEVIQAHHCNEALQMYEQIRPDFVAMDITASMDGVVACVEQLKAEEPDVLVLMMHSAETGDVAEQAMKKGARGMIEVPFKDEQICNAIQNLMAKAINETSFRKIPNFDLYLK